MKIVFDFTRINTQSKINGVLYTEIPPIGHKEQIGVISLPTDMFGKKSPKHISISITWKE